MTGIKNPKLVYLKGWMFLCGDVKMSEEGTRHRLLVTRLLSMSTSEDVIIKATYSLDDSAGNREKATKYFLFHRGVIGKSWRLKRETSALSYYLNFK